MFMKKSCLALEVLFSGGFGDDNKKVIKKAKFPTLDKHVAHRFLRFNKSLVSHKDVL